MPRTLTVASGLFAAMLLSTDARAADLSGSIAATSDYVFRGISQTQGDPALQLGLKLAFEPGWYVATWGSNVDYGAATGSDAEVDVVVGWSGALSPSWTADVNLTRYTYPGTLDGLDIDYSELIGTLTWDGRVFGTLGVSDDVFGSGASGTWVQLGARWPLADAWLVEAAVAHYALADAFVDDYQHATLGLAYTRERLTVRANAHLTSDSAETLFGDVGEPRAEVVATWAF